MVSGPFWRVAGVVVVLAAVGVVASRIPVDEGSPGSSHADAGKANDRLAWTAEDVPVRATRVFDAVAMFGMPHAEPSEWSNIPAPALSLDTVPKRPRPEAAPVRVTAAVPPLRPQMLAEVRVVPQAAGSEKTDAPAKLALLGWDVPGSDYLSRIPGALDPLAAVQAAGRGAVTVGQAVREAVRIR